MSSKTPKSVDGTVAAEPAPKKRDQSAKVRDPEAIAIDRMATIMNGLDDSARRRVMGWLTSKYVMESRSTGPYLRTLADEVYEATHAEKPQGE